MSTSPSCTLASAGGLRPFEISRTAEGVVSSAVNQPSYGDVLIWNGEIGCDDKAHLELVSSGHINVLMGFRIPICMRCCLSLLWWCCIVIVVGSRSLPFIHLHKTGRRERKGMNFDGCHQGQEPIGRSLDYPLMVAALSITVLQYSACDIEPEP